MTVAGRSRNTPCFCGSGRKLKHCCARQLTPVRTWKHATKSCRWRFYQPHQGHDRYAMVSRGGGSWEKVADELERGSETFLDHPYANVFKAMQVAVAALDEKLQASYRTLAIYPEDTRVPLATVARFWTHMGHVKHKRRAHTAQAAGRARAAHVQQRRDRLPRPPACVLASPRRRRAPVAR